MRSSWHDKAFYQDILKTVLKQGTWQGEIWNRLKNDESYLQRTAINAGHNEKRQVTQYVYIFSDITKQKHDEEVLQFLAHHDPLTELPNRTLLKDRLKLALEQARRNPLDGWPTRFYRVLLNR